MERARTSDPITQQLRALLYNWHAAIGSAFVTASQAAVTAQQGTQSGRRANPEFYDAMFAVAADKGVIDPNRLGKFLGRHKDRVVNKLRIVQSATTTGNLSKWAVLLGG
jgi:hypothetical protein